MAKDPVYKPISNVGVSNESAKGEEGEKEQIVVSEKEKKLQQIWVVCESQRQMHKLAYAYFRSRDFYYNFVPIVILTFTSGALSLFISKKDEDDCEETSILGICIGLVSLLSVAVQSVAKESNYSARAELHRNAALGMKTLKDEINFQLLDPSLTVNPNLKKKFEEQKEEEEASDGNVRENKDEEKPEEVEETSVETYRRIYMQILDSCKSVVPMKIAQPFLLVDSRLALELSEDEYKIQIRHKHGKMAEQLIAASWYNELFVQVSSFWAWPMIIPNPDAVVGRAKTTAVNTFIKKSDFLSKFELRGSLIQEDEVKEVRSFKYSPSVDV